MQGKAKPLYEDSFVVEGGNFDNAGRVSSHIKSILKKIGLASDVVRRAALVAYESEINIVSYSRKGLIHLLVGSDRVLIEAVDEGQGIADIELAMQEGYSTATEKIREMGFGAGMGLSNIRNFSDYFQITSEIGRGTCLKMEISINDAPHA